MNPWITDFAAYNLWSRPAGLLSCLALLRRAGASVALLDCLDATWRDQPWPPARADGRGHFPKTPLPVPEILKNVPRQFSRYGLPVSRVEDALTLMDPQPDLVMVTTIMTYWYPGAVTAMETVRRTWPEVPIVLGGIYPTLCPEHAQMLGLADLIIKGPVEKTDNWDRFWQMLTPSPPPLPEPDPGSMALDLYPEAGFAPLLGSRGCPFDCAYCASSSLNPGFAQRKPKQVMADITSAHDRGVRDFAFYDDALLVNREKWLFPVLEQVAREKKGIRFHTPNAMHVRELDAPLCRLLKKAGFCTIRLGLETADFTSRPDTKLTRGQWEEGLANLLEAGFDPRDIGAYILFGLPGQQPEEIERAIRFTGSFGIRPHLTYYSPIPGSRLFVDACRVSPLPLAAEPITHNNSIWPCVPGGFTWEARFKWTSLVRQFA